MLSGIVFTFFISQFDATSANRDDLALAGHLPLNTGSLVNSLRAIEANSTGKTGGKASCALGDGRSGELQTH